MDLKNQIEYWIKGAFEDLETASILIRENKFLNGLFFCHLALEKALKANYVRINNTFAPKTHNLLYLVNNSKIEFNDLDLEFLGVLMKYQLEGRYPDYSPKIPNSKTTNEYFIKTKELAECLKMML